MAVVASIVGVALVAAVTPPVLNGDTPAEAVAALPARLAGLGDLAARSADQVVRGTDGAISAMTASRSADRTAVRSTPSRSAMASADVPALSAPAGSTGQLASSAAPAATTDAPSAAVTAAAASTAPAADAAVAGLSAAPSAPTLTADEQFAARLVTLTNAERTRAGLAALATSPCATAQAVARAAVLVAQGRFEHDPLGPILAACGGNGVGENLALGYPTPEAMTAGWMASPGHRENILRAYAATGIGCVKAPAGMLCSQVFLG